MEGIRAGTYADTFADAWKLVPDREALLFRSRLAGTPVTYDGYHVEGWRRPVSFHEREASHGAYTQADRHWLVPKALLPVLPRPADQVITGAATLRPETFTVLEVSEGNVFGIWDLLCRDLVIQEDLRDTIDIEKPAYTINPAGVRVPTWAKVYTGLACRVQPAQSDETAERGLVAPLTRYEVFLAQEVTVSTECRLAWGALYLEVRSYRQAERIGDLPVIEAELVP